MHTHPHKRASSYHLQECPHHSPRCPSCKPESPLPLFFPHTTCPIHQPVLCISLRFYHFSTLPPTLIQAPCCLSKFPNGLAFLHCPPTVSSTQEPSGPKPDLSPLLLRMPMGIPTQDHMHEGLMIWSQALSPTSLLTRRISLLSSSSLVFLQFHTQARLTSEHLHMLSPLRMHFSSRFAPSLLPCRSQKASLTTLHPNPSLSYSLPCFIIFLWHLALPEVTLFICLHVIYLPHKVISPVKAVNICSPHDLKSIWTE